MAGTSQRTETSVVKVLANQKDTLSTATATYAIAGWLSVPPDRVISVPPAEVFLAF